MRRSRCPISRPRCAAPTTRLASEALPTHHPYAPFSDVARSPCATSPKALPLARRAFPRIHHFTAYSCQLTAYREFAAPRHPSCGLAAALLQGPACQGLPQLRRIPVTIHISAAKPLSNLMSPVRSTCSTVGPAQRRPTYHPYAPSIRFAGVPIYKKAALSILCAATTIPHSSFLIPHFLQTK